MRIPTKDPAKPDFTDRAAADRAARQEREAAALRENLRKRKAQARAREQANDQAPKPEEQPREGTP